MTVLTVGITAEEARTITGNAYLSRREAAQYLGITESTLSKHTHDGPSYHKVFGRVVYSVADLDNWTVQRRVHPRG